MPYRVTDIIVYMTPEIFNVSQDLWMFPFIGGGGLRALSQMFPFILDIGLCAQSLRTIHEQTLNKGNSTNTQKFTEN